MISHSILKDSKYSKNLNKVSSLTWFRVSFESSSSWLNDLTAKIEYFEKYHPNASDYKDSFQAHCYNPEDLVAI